MFWIKRGSQRRFCRYISSTTTSPASFGSWTCVSSNCCYV